MPIREPNIVKLYRMSYFCYRLGIPILPKFVKWIIRRVYCADIPYEIEAGTNFQLAHSGLGVVLHQRCQFGNNVTISQNVTIGGNQGQIDVPKLGNNVFIAPGAVVLGDITIGNNVIIGANSVVTKSVPDNTVIVGIPGRALRKTGPGDNILTRQIIT